MAAYALVELEITNLDGMRPYIEAVRATIAAHGGRYLVSAGITEVAEGSLGQYPVKVVLEFSSMGGEGLVQLCGIPDNSSASYEELKMQFRLGGRRLAATLKRPAYGHAPRSNSLKVS